MNLNSLLNNWTKSFHRETIFSGKSEGSNIPSGFFITLKDQEISMFHGNMGEI